MVAASVAQRYERLAMPKINTQINKLLVSIPEASARLSVAASTGRDWLCKGIFPVATVKINGMRLVPVKLLEQYVEELTEAALRGNSTKGERVRIVKRKASLEGIDNSNLSK